VLVKPCSAHLIGYPVFLNWHVLSVLIHRLAFSLFVNRHAWMDPVLVNRHVHPVHIHRHTLPLFVNRNGYR